MSKSIFYSIAAATLISVSGCASTYGNLVSGSGLGAQEYTPAVVVKPGGEGMYSQVLGQCRNAASARQVTAAQSGQLNTIANVGSGALSGAAQGMATGSTIKELGLGGSVNKATGIGAVAGSLGALAGSFGSGTKNTASETRLALLTCLRRMDPQSQYYVLVE
jgi:hypothetical protein